MSKKLLYFNLALDENDTSLGFAIDWIKTIAKNYDHVDVVTLKKVSNLNFQVTYICFFRNETSYFFSTLKELKRHRLNQQIPNNKCIKSCK